MNAMRVLSGVYVAFVVGFVCIVIFAVVVGVAESCSLKPAPSYGYTIEFHGAGVPDMKTCQNIRWEDTLPFDETVLGYKFLYDILIANGVKATLTTSSLVDKYGRRFNSTLEYIPERFESNIAEICNALGVDRENPSFHDLFEMGECYGGFEESRCGLQAKLAIRGFVYERTYGSKDVLRMTEEHVRRIKPCFIRRGGLGIRMVSVLVERIYTFYNYEGECYATIRIEVPHCMARYSFKAGIIAAKKAVDLAFKEFLKGDNTKRIIKGRIKVDAATFTASLCDDR